MKNRVSDGENQQQASVATGIWASTKHRFCRRRTGGGSLDLNVALTAGVVHRMNGVARRGGYGLRLSVANGRRRAGIYFSDPSGISSLDFGKIPIRWTGGAWQRDRAASAGVAISLGWARKSGPRRRARYSGGAASRR
jgi:hypothetical protein